MKQIEWYGCYRASWNAAPLIPEAYSHPAKVAFGLAERIYKHMLEQGYIKPGQVIVDPFGGIAGFAFHALRNGLHWKGIELEQNFVELGQANIALWNNRYAAHFPNWGTAEIMQGDSRFLAAVLREAGGVVSSPPFSNQFPAHDKPEKYKGFEHVGSVKYTAGYAYADNSPGQLGSMKEGDIAAVVDGAISSPPYAAAINANGEGPGMAGNEAQRQRIYAGSETERAAKSRNIGYGSTEGNLGNLPPGDIAAVIPLQDTGNQICDTIGVVYLMFHNPGNGVAFILEVFVFSSILSYLGRLGMPIVSINLNDEVEPHQKEIAMIVGDLELSNVFNSRNVQETGEGVFEFALSGLPITAHGTIDPAAVLEAMRLHGKDTPAGRALFFDTGSFVSSKTGTGAVFTPPFLDSILSSDDFFSAMLAGDSNPGRPKIVGTNSGTIATAVLGLSFVGLKGVSATVTNKHDSFDVTDGSAFPGTIYPPALFDCVRFYVESLRANQTSAIINNYVAGIISPLPKFAIAGKTAKNMNRPFDRLLLSLKGDTTLTAFQSNNAHSSPHIIASEPDKSTVSAAVTSPPYAEVVSGAGEGPGARFDHVTHRGENATKKSSLSGYGQTEGNLGNLAAGAVTSPPYESKLAAEDMEFYRKKCEQTGRNPNSAHAQGINSYGASDNNIGNQTGPTFWAAARDILVELYAVLTPGGYAAFVTGNYRRDGKVVPFGEQWLQLCEAVGFVGIEHITAWKYEPRPAQLDIFGNVHSRDVHRVSFFRRLDNQKNPGNEILSEEVWIVRKPAVK